MEYDYIKLKSYQYRVVGEGEKEQFILSFSEKHHVKVSKKAKFILDHFDGEHTLTQLREQLEEEGISCSEEEIKKFINKIMVENNMVDGIECEKVSNSRLWFHLPIFDSKKLLFIIKPLTCFFHKPINYLIIFGAICCCVWNVYKVAYLGQVYREVNSLSLILLIYLSLFWHEIGHVTAAYNYGITAGDIGIGMYLCNPVFYVDLTNIWRLDRKARIIVDAAGIYFQFIIIIPLTLAAFISKNKFLYYINVSIVLAALFNLVPLFRLDGFWIFCDYYALENITTKAFVIVKSVILKKKDGVVARSKKSYIFFAFIYTISTSIMVVMGVVLAVRIVMNRTYIWLQMKSVCRYMHEGDICKVLAVLNNVFVYVIPVIYIGIILIQLLKSLITTSKIKGKNHTCLWRNRYEKKH